MAVLATTLLIAFGSAYALTAQTPAKKALTIDDYTKWRSISGQELSGDGKWVTYVLQYTNVPTAEAKPVLHLLNLGTNQDLEIPNGSGATFSADSKWFAYQVDPAAGRGGRGAGRAGGGNPTANAPAGGSPDAQGGGNTQGGRGANAQPQQQRRVEIRNLETGTVTRQWQDIASFTFSADSNFLLLRRRPANAAGGGAGRTGDAGGAGGGGAAQGGGGQAAGNAAPANPDAPRGVDMTVHNLQTGKDLPIPDAGDALFNKKGDLLVYNVDGAVKDGNGLFLLDLKLGRTVPLDNDAKSYNRLTWSEDGESVAVLKGLTPERARERENVLLVFSNVRAALGDSPALPAMTLDPAKAAGFPKNWVVSDRATLSWSDDGKRVFFGMKEQVLTPEAAPRRSTDEVADVDVWNSTDERIQSMQMVRAEQERNFTFREAFDASAGKFVKLADETMRDLELSPDGKWAVGRDTRGYISDYKRPAADFYRVNTATGERTLMFKNQLTGAGVLGISPDSKYFLYWKDNKFQAYELDMATTRTLGGPSTGGPSFVDMEYDHPGPKPSYGIAGYTNDGRNVIVQQRYDLWLMPLDGTAPKNLTNGVGTKGEIRFRYVRTEPLDAGGGPGGGGGRGGGAGGGARGIDLSKPVTLSAYGEYTKKAGFYELNNGQLREIIYEDASFSTPTKAAKADTYLFTRQTFVEFPDLRVSGPDFKASKTITNANPQQSEFTWGRRQLFDFKDRLGHRLQGILAIPDDYKPGEKRPMIVTFYEDNSQNMHRYSAPSYITGMGSIPMQAVSEGYITMLPDIHYHVGSSHSDQLESVEAAVKKVIEMGIVDPKRIGLHGHSYGGEGAAFIGTRSRLFAAVGMGAGVTDLFTDFSQSWGWSYQVSGGSGANGNDYYLYGQGRWGVAPWDNPELYHFESALSHVREVTQPFLIMHGTADPTVSFTEGMNFYNALRYNNKNAIMLAYPGEGHGLRGLANRKDLTIRYFQYFNHYLKGEPAPKWMTDGVPYLLKDQNRDPRAGAGRAGGSGGQ